MSYLSFRLILFLVSYSIVDNESNSILWAIVFESKLKPKQNRGYLLPKKRLCLYIRISIFEFRVLEVSFDIFIVLYSVVDKESNLILWSIVFESKLNLNKIEVIYFRKRGYVCTYGSLYLSFVSKLSFRLIFYIVSYSIVDKESYSILWSIVFQSKLKPKQNRGYLLPKKRLCLYIRISIFQFRVELESLIFFIVSYSVVDNESNSILWSIVFESKLKPKQNRGYLLPKKRLCFYIWISIFEFRVELESLIFFIVSYSIVDKKIQLDTLVNSFLKQTKT